MVITMTIAFLILVLYPGLIQSSADLGTFMRRTLLHTQQPDTSLSVAEEALSFLIQSGFVLVPDWLKSSHVTLITSSDWLFTSGFVERKEGKLLGTPFGTAVYKSSLDPSLAKLVLADLQKANKHLVLYRSVHLVYLCIPPNIE